ncbi:protein vacuoleless1 [Tanacetum coccineum]
MWSNEIWRDLGLEVFTFMYGGDASTHKFTLSGKEMWRFAAGYLHALYSAVGLMLGGFDLRCMTAIAPDQLVWCGMDSVLLYWDDMLLMVGPYGDPVRYIYDEPIILIPECDGARILSNSTMEFLQRVPLLLGIGEEDTALTKSTESGDTDLIYLVLFHIWQKRPPLELFGMIQARPLARDLFIRYARCYKHEFLKDFFLSTGQLHDVAYLLWKESWEMANNPMAASRGYPLHGPRIKLIEKAQSLFAETKEHVFESKAAEEHAKLLRIQHELEVSTQQPIFVDSSISDTIRTCIVLGNHRAAMKVKTEFKVSDKRWYWLKVFALATIRDWDALEKFSKEKRPPVGYKPFVEACIDADEKTEAVKYITKLADPREKAEAYARIGMAKEAAEAASQTKDGELLERLRNTLQQNSTASSIFDTLRDRVHIHTINKGLIREDLYVRVKGKTHKVNAVEEVRDIINFDIQEIAKTNPDDHNETDGSNKVDENDMQIDEEDDV